MVFLWEMLLVGEGGSDTNFQNVLLHAFFLDVVFTQSPDLNQNKAIKSRTDGLFCSWRVA